MDTVEPARFIFAFLFVIGLIGVMGIVLKRSDKIRAKLGAAGVTSGRLAISEVMYIDNRRKLVLVKRDDKEHLLLIAGDREVVIESGIPIGDSTAHDANKN